MVNRVILVGNIGKDPEVRTLDNGSKVAKFSLATNENYRDKSGEWQQNTEWHNIVAWRSLAEKAENLQKGNAVYLEGKLQTRTWEAQDGSPRKTTEVVASYFRVVTKNERGPETMQETEERIGKWVSDFLEETKKESQESEPDDLPF